MWVLLFEKLILLRLVLDPLAFRPNPSNLVLDRTASEDEDEAEMGGDGDRSAVYRPPRLAAMPYVEGPAKGTFTISTHIILPRGELIPKLSLNRQKSKENGSTVSPHLRHVCWIIFFDSLRRNDDWSLSLSRSFHAIRYRTPFETSRRLRDGSFHSNAHVQERRETSTSGGRRGRVWWIGCWKGREKEVGWIRCRV